MRRVGPSVVICVVLTVIGALGLVMATIGPASPPTAPGRRPTDRHATLVAADSFNRRRADLGMADTKQRWRPILGGWVVDQEARVVRSGGSRNLAVLDVRVPARSVEARLARIAAGGGIVFRFRDRDNYWQLVAVPQLATWNVQKVVGGKLSSVTNTGFSSTKDGTTLQVNVGPDDIQIGVNGRLAASLKDGDLAGANGIGMVAPAHAADATRWDWIRAGLAPVVLR